MSMDTHFITTECINSGLLSQFFSRFLFVEVMCKEIFEIIKDTSREKIHDKGNVNDQFLFRVFIY